MLNLCVLDLSRIFGGVIVIWQHLCLSVNEICDRVNIYKEHIILHLLVNYWEVFLEVVECREAKNWLKLVANIAMQAEEGSLGGAIGWDI